MAPQAYSEHVLQRQGLSNDDYASSPMGSNLLDAKKNRRQDDSDMGPGDYTKYVMRRHNLVDQDAPSSPLSSALLKRKTQFQHAEVAAEEDCTPQTPEGVENYTQYVVNRHGLDDDVPSSPLSSALMKRKAEIQDGQATAGKAGVESYTKSVMRRHNLDDGAASSPLSSALLQRKAQNQQKVVEHVDPVQVGALVSMFEMFDMYDIDGNGFIDKDEYWAISSQLPRADGLEWTREMSDDEVDTIDTNGDGVISPEEFYRHCRKNISANEATYAEALAQHQDVFFNPGELDLLDSQDYVKDVLSSHGLKNEELPSSPLASAIMAKKRGTYKDQPTLAQNVIFEKSVQALIDAFKNFDEADEDGNGFIDPDEYYRFTCKLFPNDQRTREESDAEVQAIDLNGDGLISPEEFYQHCRLRLAATRDIYTEALARHQDVLMDLSRVGSFCDSDREVQLLVGTVRTKEILEDFDGTEKQPIIIQERESFAEYFQGLFAGSDVDGSGGLELSEVTRLLKSCKFKFSPKDIAALVSAADVNEDGSVSYVEFVPMMLDLLGLLKEEAHPESSDGLDPMSFSFEVLESYFSRLFTIGDVDNSGFLDPNEVTELLGLTGFNFNEAQIEQMISQADVNHDGLIEYTEFVPMMLGVMQKMQAASPEERNDIRKPLSLEDHSPEVLQVYFQRLFQMADADGSGALEPSEVSELLTLSGFQMEPHAIKQVIEQADVNHDGSIDFEEFVPMMVNLLTAQAEDSPLNVSEFTETELQEYFRTLFEIGDADGNGKLSVQEMQELLSLSGFKFKPDEVTAIVATADSNNDGEIDYEEFVPMMLKMTKQRF